MFPKYSQDLQGFAGIGDWVRCEKQRISGLLTGAFREHFCSHNPESFLFFFGISANADMKKAEVPFQYPSFDKMVWNL